ncbi:tetratricopeptide repeat protein [Rhodobacter calidifons]|uniref:Tetratricopeptide repeat protein n=1 Tax=Rhodobacter calidifons TaxID=2715277 RepID=A0ABX0G7B0_9RHOB|nr:tetratricopeptide repeat protein [Rhodobacter calidifons]NHB76636.1 tetratricopeptide repeat protein [Rhodobacter calidifons]
MRSVITRTLCALVLAAALGAPLQAEDDINSGAYLAARIAERENDFRAAFGWYAQAMASDPGNPALLDGAILAGIGSGDIVPTIELAAIRRDLGKDRGIDRSQLADLVLLADEAQREDYAAIQAEAAAGRDVGDLANQLVLAWAKVGDGRMSEALEAFDTVAKREGYEAFGYYHKALALASVGDFEGADEILSGKAAGPIVVMRRGVFAHVQILSQLERNQDALALLDRSFGPGPDPLVDPIRRRLQAGEPLPFDTVRNARDGIAEVFFSISTALQGGADPVYTLLHLHVAGYLRPDHSDALLMTADVLTDLRQYDLAAETYARFRPEDPAFVTAEIGRAGALRSQGKADAAIEALRTLARAHGDLVGVQFALGDMLRGQERFAEAVAAYSSAIELASAAGKQDWVLYFYRGICHEQSQNWALAEADFRRALELNPTQPQVLNYLGYGLVDRGEKLDEALGMIEKAVAGDPKQGYIIDSLAWALFKLGRYAEALEPMERASLLEPVDPIVTDHLGDVYWMNNRKLEARFQWRRALSFNPTEKDKARILRKLEVGLDAVMAAEGTAPAPVKAAENGN